MKRTDCLRTLQGSASPGSSLGLIGNASAREIGAKTCGTGRGIFDKETRRKLPISSSTRRKVPLRRRTKAERYRQISVAIRHPNRAPNGASQDRAECRCHRFIAATRGLAAAAGSPGRGEDRDDLLAFAEGAKLLARQMQSSYPERQLPNPRLSKMLFCYSG
jgi:hypothetical protein